MDLLDLELLMVERRRESGFCVRVVSAFICCTGLSNPIANLMLRQDPHSPTILLFSLCSPELTTFPPPAKLGLQTCVPRHSQFTISHLMKPDLKVCHLPSPQTVSPGSSIQDRPNSSEMPGDREVSLRHALPLSRKTSQKATERNLK